MNKKKNLLHKVLLGASATMMLAFVLLPVTGLTGMPPEDVNVRLTIGEQPSLTTLSDLIITAELGDTLENESEEFTVFAPNNAAFNALSANTVFELQKEENQADLVELLQYHIVSGTVMSGDLTNDQQITTVQGDTLTVSIEGETIRLVDEMGTVTPIIEANIEASNGAVHIVENVLLNREYDYEEGGPVNPETPDPTDEEEETSNPTSESTPVTYPTVVEYIQANTSLSTLLAAVQAANLADTLKDSSAGITVLAPTNAAFDKLPEGTLEELLKSENIEQLQKLLQYHVVNVSSLGELTNGKTFTTLTGETLTVVVNDDGEFIQDAAGNLSRVALPVTVSDGSSVGIAAGSVYTLDTVLSAEEAETLEDTGLNIILPFIIGTILMLVALKVYTKSSEA